MILICIRCTINFYTNGKIIKSCQDILESNSTMMSFYQINGLPYVLIGHSEYPTELCPLFFKDTIIGNLNLMDNSTRKTL